MPWDGLQNYYYPPGTRGVPDQTVESEPYNTFLDDLVNNDLNKPRPIHRGGTAATTAPMAVDNLKALHQKLHTTNFDAVDLKNGGFYSLDTATAPPVAGHRFVGLTLTADGDEEGGTLVLDVDAEPGQPKLYYRSFKDAGAWTAWVALPELDPVTGLNISKITLEAPAGTSKDIIGEVPEDPDDLKRWVMSLGDEAPETGTPANSGSDFRLRRYDDDGVLLDSPLLVKRDEGLLTLRADPTAALHAVTKQYVDAKVATVPPVAQCYLKFVNTGQLNLEREHGNKIFINGEIVTIPSGLVVSSIGSAANQLYQLYGFNNAGVLDLELSTTVATKETTYGTWIKLGDPTRLLLGLIWTNASSQFSQMGTASYFNRRAKSGVSALGSGTGVTGAPWRTISASLFVDFVTWEDEDVQMYGHASLVGTAATAAYLAGGIGAVANTFISVTQVSTSATLMISGMGTIRLARGKFQAVPYGGADTGTVTYGASYTKIVLSTQG